MPARLRPSRAFRDGILLHDPDDANNPIRLYFDRERFNGKPYTISVTPRGNEAGSLNDDSLQEWTWSNGPAGAGTTVETPESYGRGASEYGERVWLRRLGVATAAGALVEYDVPLLTRTGGGQFSAGQMYNGSLWITTLGRTAVQVPGAGLGFGLLEKDFGAGTQTLGIAVFAGAGSSRLYVGEFNQYIREFDGATWTDGAAGTNRAWLETPHWAIGSQLATGGAAGTSGAGAHRLVGTNSTGTGFYHCSGDPKVAANWSSLETVGNGGSKFPIRRTVASNNTVWFGTGLGVLGVDELGYDPNLTKWMERVASVNNCAAIEYWDGRIWGAHEAGLMTFSPTGERIDLGEYVQFGARTGAGPIFGRPLALCATPDGLMVGYYNAANTSSYIGCLLVDPDGSYRWSMAEAVIEGEIVTYLQQAVDTSGNPGLVIGTVDATDSTLHLYRQYLPKYGDPITDIVHGGPFVASAAWSLTLSRSNGGRPIAKSFRRYSLEADYLGASYPSNSVAVQVAVDGGSFGTVGTATRSSRWTSVPPQGYVRATDFQVRLAAQNAATQPVVVRSFGARYQPNPERTKTKTYPIRFTEQHTGHDPWRTLRAVEQAQQTTPSQITDELGRVVEASVDWTEELVTEEATGKGWVVHGTISVTQTREVAGYDEGALWDDGEAYS